MTSTRRIYKITAHEGYEWARAVNSDDYEAFRHLPERNPGDPWQPIEMYLLKEGDRGRRRKRADMPILAADVLVLRDDAIETVGPLLQPHGELLPLHCEDARLVLFSAHVVGGAVDLEKSEVIRFNSSGRIMQIRHPVFREEVVKNLMAFRPSEKPLGYLYLAEPLVDAILATGMTTGTTFTVAK